MKFIIKREGRSVEISEVNSSILVYRIPYQNLLKDKSTVMKLIKNKFIVYILFGENNQENDVVYVGKSTNGLLNRPTSHKQKFDNWRYCYVLTQFEERTFFNDGIIQYIENEVCKRINDIKHYKNTTELTSNTTANNFDIEDCKAYLEKAYEMLDVLGLDLLTYMEPDPELVQKQETEDDSQIMAIPDGKYTLSRKIKRWGNKTATGEMQVAHGKFIVLTGSTVCPNEGPGLMDSIRIRRENSSISNNILKEDVVFNSPSSAAYFIIGSATNGWFDWKNSEGKPISVYRELN